MTFAIGALVILSEAGRRYMGYRGAARIGRVVRISRDGTVHVQWTGRKTTQPWDPDFLVEVIP